jgi:hypothetical protein
VKRVAAIGLLILVFLSPLPASAHVLKENNGISAVLHMPPDDDPVAGRPVELDLSFGDDSGHFSLLLCDCELQVSGNGRTIYRAAPRPAVNGANLDSFTMVTFPAAGAYDLHVSGTPRGGNFRPFKFDYVIRVTNPADASSQGQGLAVLIISAGSLAILVLIAQNGISSGDKYKRLVKPKGKKRA